MQRDRGNTKTQASTINYINCVLSFAPPPPPYSSQEHFAYNKKMIRYKHRKKRTYPCFNICIHSKA